MKLPGTINGYHTCGAKVNGKRFSYDSTIKGLVTAAVAIGAKVGDKITTETDSTFVLIAAPGDTRCNFVWANRIGGPQG